MKNLPAAVALDIFENFIISCVNLWSRFLFLNICVEQKPPSHILYFKKKIEQNENDLAFKVREEHH